MEKEAQIFTLKNSSSILPSYKQAAFFTLSQNVIGFHYQSDAFRDKEAERHRRAQRHLDDAIGNPAGRARGRGAASREPSTTAEEIITDADGKPTGMLGMRPVRDGKNYLCCRRRRTQKEKKRKKINHQNFMVVIKGKESVTLVRMRRLMKRGERLAHAAMPFLNERRLLEQEASVGVASQGLKEGTDLRHLFF